MANEMGFDPEFELRQLSYLIFEEKFRYENYTTRNTTLNDQLNKFFRDYPRNIRLGQLNLGAYFVELIEMRVNFDITDVELLF
ncbi:hypothetical protein [Pseudolactococcus hodotermopsidis]|uniref:hypothetical protein n=1 Tax=Pseudolactococcus hodotermopsidis TaxID=2709157 RepID=UPI001555E568|nr:hypothetical protein [Lactococcus hodotermopsidis]